MQLLLFFNIKNKLKQEIERRCDDDQSRKLILTINQTELTQAINHPGFDSVSLY